VTKAAFIKRNGALLPMDEDGRELIAALPDDKQVIVSVKAARNPRHHRLLFHLLNRAIEGGAWGGDISSLLDYIKIGTHHVRTIVGPDGKPYYLPLSIDYESMPQDKFSRWFDRALWLICERLLGGHDWQELRSEIVETVDGGLADRARRAA
jgi:hypothetical protein